ncbi:hypothetical protein BDR07DRAFT_1502501 [Suillus spraguei]|nr:hypothetical protein BDR07DRAFT_1502501 [Suillus spraguei]
MAAFLMTIFGLNSRKVWNQFSHIIEADLDASYRFKEFPHWRNQKHPNQAMDIVFTDSSIPENISKMILYAAHDVVTEEDCLLGYLLLRCICLYIEVDMYASLEVHTSDTICEGRNVVQMFSGFLKQYIDKTADIEDKGWNFPKLYMDVHLFDDIKVKGATRNYNTKPNKKMHGSLKDSYLLRTNIRNVAEQILHINHWQLVAEDIHHLDAADDALDATDDAVIPLAGFFHVKVGSKQPPLTFELVKDIYHSDDAFSNLRIRLNDFLNDFLPAINIPLLQGKRICLRASDEITEFRFLKVNYESMVDWQQHTDYLHCSPQFFGAPCFDCVFIFGKHTFPLALVHPYDAPTGIRLRKDKNFNLFRVRARTQAQSQFFSVRSIICGALLVPDGPSDYLVVDTVDTDMFVCMREMHLEVGHLCFFIKSHLIAPPSHSNISLPSTSSSNYTLQHSPSVHPSINQALVNIDVSTAVMYTVIALYQLPPQRSPSHSSISPPPALLHPTTPFSTRYSVNSGHLICLCLLSPVPPLLSFWRLQVSFAYVQATAPSVVPYSSELRQQLLTCTGRLRMAFVVLGMAWWVSRGLERPLQQNRQPIICKLKLSQTWFEREPDLLNAFRDVRSRVRPNG